MAQEHSLVYGFNEIDRAVDVLMEQLSRCQVFTFTGTLGAGKTTLIQELLKRSGVEGIITSPTFTYVNVYTMPQGTFYHFDCYRINSLDAFLEAGFGEYLYQPSSWAFVEWPEVIEPLLTNKVCAVHIDYEGNDKRKLSYSIKP